MAQRQPPSAQREGPQAPARFGRPSHPFLSLRDEMGRMLDDFWRGFDQPAAFGAGGLAAPSVDVAEDEKEVRVTAEIPGVDMKDVEVTFADNVLTIRGEKREESERKDRNFRLMERSYGSFQRAIPIDAEVDEDRIEANCRNGVLTVVLPKTAEQVRKARKIEIKGG